MINTIGFSGHKQSGKNVCANLIAGPILHSIGFATHVNGITGELLVPCEGSDDVPLDLTCRIGEVYEHLEEEIHDYVKLYSFADELKEFCIKMFGLTIEQCYGTNEQKNTKTNIRWLKFKKYIPRAEAQAITTAGTWRSYMTARELLQVFGTDVIRNIYDNAWVDGLMAKINHERKYRPEQFAIITDIRFPNEVVGTQDFGGKVVRLLRNPHPEDCHTSELALDKFTEFDNVIDNREMTISEMSVELAKFMQDQQ